MHGKASLVLLLVLFFTTLHANVVAPTIHEQADLGDDTMLKDFTYSIGVDCTASAIRLTVLDDKNKPVGGASTYLKYVDFSTPLIDQGTTDQNGFILEKLPGSPTLMRGLFILVLEKSGFRDKEIHFDISGCYTNTTAKPPVKPPANNTNPPANSTPGNYTRPPANASGTNQSGNATGNPTGTPASTCPLALLVPLLTLFKCVKR